MRHRFTLATLLRNAFCVFASVLVSTFVRADDRVAHVVTHTQSVSKILYDLNLKPIYGLKGTLRETELLNPELLKKNGSLDLVFPGDRLILPREQVRVLASSADLDAGLKAESNSDPAVTVIEEQNAVPPPSIDSDDSKSGKQGSSITVLSGQDSFTVCGSESNGTAGKLATKSVTPFELRWASNLDERHALHFGFGLQAVSFARSATRSFEANSRTLLSRKVGYTYRFANRLLGNVFLGQRDQVFYRAVNPSALVLDKVPVNYAEVSIDLRLYATNDIEVDLPFGYRRHFAFQSEPYRTSNAYGFQAGLRVSQKVGTFSIISEASYSQDRFPMREIDFNREDLNLRFGLAYRFGSSGATP